MEILTAPQLESVTNYKHPGVVERLSTKLGISQKQAELLFEDTKKFLFLATNTNNPISPPPLIDEGWHNFILFTRDYADFCKNVLGTFVHHVPHTGERDLGDVSENSSSETLALAQSYFGNSLSQNWKPRAGDCSPDSNCEDAPGDCAINHCHSAW